MNDHIYFVYGLCRIIFLWEQASTSNKDNICAPDETYLVRYTVKSLSQNLVIPKTGYATIVIILRPNSYKKLGS